MYMMLCVCSMHFNTMYLLPTARMSMKRYREGKKKKGRQAEIPPLSQTYN